MCKTIQGILTIAISIALYSCNSQKQNNGDLPVIDIVTAYQDPAIQLSLSEVVDHIEYVKLETKSECLIGRLQSLAFSENYIVLYTSSNRIMLFTKGGAYLHDISGYGKGPDEYTSIYLESLIISPDENYVAFRSPSKIHLVKLDGSFQNSLTVESGAVDAITFDHDGSLTVYQQKQFLPDSGGWLILKYDESLAIKDSLLFAIPDKTTLGQMQVPDLFISHGNDMYFRQVFNDTVYKISKTKNSELIEPSFTLNLGEMKLASFQQSWEEFSLKYFLVTGLHVSDQYFFIKLEGRARKPEPGAGANEFVWFNRQNREVMMSNGIIINDMDGVNDFWIKSTPKNGGFWDPIEIVSAKPFVEKGSAKVEDLATPKNYEALQQLLADSDIEDNPIIRILHLK